MRPLTLILGLSLAFPSGTQALEVIKLGRKPTPTVVKEKGPEAKGPSGAQDRDDAGKGGAGESPKADKTKTTPEERGLEGPPHNEQADAPAWGWGKDKKDKKPSPTALPTAVRTRPPAAEKTPGSSPAEATATPVTVTRPVTILEVVTVEPRPVTVILVVTPTPVPASPVTVTRPVTIQVVVTSTPVIRRRVVYRRVPAPASRPRPRATASAPVHRTASAPSPCGVGWVWDLGFSAGADKKNDSLKELWRQGVPEGLSWGGDPVNSSLETALMLRLAWFHVGGFFNWHYWSLGSLAESDLSGTPTEYDLNLNALSYGLKMRFKDCRFPLLADLAAGELALSGARFTARDAEGKVFEAALKGRAPYGRIDLGWDFAPARDLDLILSVGYQRALMESLTGRVTADRYDPSQVGAAGTLKSAVDGGNIRADFSGPRAGLTLSFRF
jgi:hypothetical protein